MTPPTEIHLSSGILFSSVFNLNTPATYLHWSFIDISVPNAIVIVAMLVIFALAVLVPLPNRYGDLPSDDHSKGVATEHATEDEGLDR